MPASCGFLRPSVFNWDKTRLFRVLLVERPFKTQKGEGRSIETDLFERLFRAYADTIYRIALNYTRNPQDAEDVAQNALLRCLRADQAFESDEHMRNWPIRVAVNESKRWLGAPWRRLLAGAQPADAAFLQDAGLEPAAQELWETLMRLPEKYRVPLYLFYYEGQSTGQIAEALDLSVSGVTTRLARGRKKLKNALKGEFEDDE